MAAIDYTIPNQFKGLQLESPINAMTQAVQLRNLQEASQMNALRRQEYQRTREEEGAVRNWFASGKKLDSPEALNELYQIAPGLAPGIEKNILERGKTQAEIGYKQAQTGYENFKARKEQLDFTEKALQSSTTPELARGHIQQAIDLKYVTPEVGAQMLGSVPDDPAKFAAWRTNLLTHSMTAKDQLERTEKLQKARYNQYRFDAMSYGDPVLTEAEWLATEQQQPDSARIEQVPAPTEAAPAPAPGAAEAAPAGATEGSAAPITYQFKKRDFGGVDPRAAMLLSDKPEELAKLIQKKRDEERLTGDFRNIVDAERMIADLEKDPTPLNTRIIASLREQIKAVNEGKATKINMPVSLSTEKKWGETFGTEVAKQDIDLKKAAEGAPEAAQQSNRILQILSTGQAFTGTGANVKLQLAKLLRLGGVNDNEAIANTEVLLSSLANTTLGAIKSSGLGSGQGFTDKDLKFLNSAKAGEITYDAASLKYLADLAYKASKASADKWNKRRSQMPQDVIKSIGIDTSDIEVPPMFGAKPTGGSKPAGKIDTNNKWLK
jgi:hypothetical protein